MRLTVACPTSRCAGAWSRSWSGSDVRGVDVPAFEFPVVLAADLLPIARAVQPCDLAGAGRGYGDRPRDYRIGDREAWSPRPHHRRPAGRLLAVDRMGISLSTLRPDQLGGA